MVFSLAFGTLLVMAASRVSSVGSQWTRGKLNDRTREQHDYDTVSHILVFKWVCTCDAVGQTWPTNAYTATMLCCIFDSNCVVRKRW